MLPNITLLTGVVAEAVTLHQSAGSTPFAYTRILVSNRFHITIRATGLQAELLAQRSIGDVITVSGQLLPEDERKQKFCVKADVIAVGGAR